MLLLQQLTTSIILHNSVIVGASRLLGIIYLTNILILDIFIYSQI